MKKIIFLFLIVFGLSNTFVTHASWSRWSNSSGKTFYGDLVFNENSRDVKFTQDDNYFYFDITQNVSKEFGETNRLQIRYDMYNRWRTFNSGSGFNIALAPFASINSLHHYEEDNSSVKYRWWSFTGSEDDAFSKYRCTWSRTPSDRTYTWRVQENYCNYNFAIDSTIHTLYGGTTTLTTPIIYDVSVSWTGNPSDQVSSTNGNYWYLVRTSNVFKYKLKIKKEDIDTFRYCMPINVGNFDAASDDEGNYFPFGMSLNNVIDLKLYSSCDHNWVYLYKDNNIHRRYCDKCKWEKEEEHDFCYSYDGMDNNHCICNANRNVNIKISDNIGKININFLATPSSTLEPVYLENVGYSFRYIDDKKICGYDGLETVVISTVSNIPDKVPNESHEYTIVYNIHKYYVNYKKENNCDLLFDVDMPQKIVNYNENTTLDECKYQKNGYTFIGWAVMPDINTVVFYDKQPIYNLFNDDGAILNLYPVYNPYKYIVKFTPGRGKGYMEDQICTYGVDEKIKGFNYTLERGITFLNWQYEGIDIKPNTTSTLEKFVHNDNAVIVLDSRLYIQEVDEKASYKDSPSKAGKNNTYSGKIGPGINIDKSDELEIDNIESVIYEYIYNVDDNSDNKANNEEIDNEMDENRDINNRAYLIVSTNSTILSNDNDKFGKYVFFDGVLLALGIVGKMIFCAMFVFTLLYLVFILINLNEKKEKKNI